MNIEQLFKHEFIQLANKNIFDLSTIKLSIIDIVQQQILSIRLEAMKRVRKNRRILCVKYKIVMKYINQKNMKYSIMRLENDFSLQTPVVSASSSSIFKGFNPESSLPKAYCKKSYKSCLIFTRMPKFSKCYNTLLGKTRNRYSITGTFVRGKLTRKR